MRHSSLDGAGYGPPADGQELVRRGLTAMLDETRQELAGQRYRAAYLDWRIQAIEASRSWRLLRALSDAARHPWRVGRASRDLVGAVRRVPVPQPPHSGTEEDTPVLDPPVLRAPHRPGVRAVVLGGTVLRSALSTEWRQVSVTPGDWRAQLAAPDADAPPDLLLVSSCADTWWFDEQEGPPEIDRLLTWCRNRGVPCVYWHTGPQIDLSVARHVVPRATAVYTMWERIAGQLAQLAHGRDVGYLGPAAFPLQHNPMRAAQGAVPGGRVGTHGLVFISDREAGDPLLDALRPSQEAPNPCALAAAGNVCIGSPAEAARLPGVVSGAADTDRARTIAATLLGNLQLRHRAAHLAMREALTRHTYSDRVQKMLTDIGITAQRTPHQVSVVLPTRRPQQLNHALANVARQTHRGVQLVLVSHGLPIEPNEIERRAKEHGIEETAVVVAGRELSLGDCLNLGVEAADGEIVAKMDDDDVYGSHYLSDLLLAFDYTGAPVVGKGAHYVHFAEDASTVLCNAEKEHTFTDTVLGSTLTVRRDLARELRFASRTGGEDGAFLETCRRAGVPVYSADRYSYVCARAADPELHAWQVTREHLLRAGRIEFFGDPATHVCV